MRVLELAIASVLAGLGVRSVAYWARRRLDSDDVKDHLLFALYLTGRAGLWFAFAGAFLIFALVGGSGRGFADDVAPYRWYLLVFLLLGAVQALAGFFLGRRGASGSRDGLDDVV